MKLTSLFLRLSDFMLTDYIYSISANERPGCSLNFHTQKRGAQSIGALIDFFCFSQEIVTKGNDVIKLSNTSYITPFHKQTIKPCLELPKFNVHWSATSF